MRQGKVIQFSLATLLAVTAVFAIEMAVLRRGFDNWQVAAEILATLVFFGIVLRTRNPKHRSTLLSIPAMLLWIGVGGFLLKWYRAWTTNSLEPGLGTSWDTLYVIFAIATLAMAAGLWITVTAWLGKSTVERQVVSMVLGFLFLWAIAGD